MKQAFDIAPHVAFDDVVRWLLESIVHFECITVIPLLITTLAPILIGYAIARYRQQICLDASRFAAAPRDQIVFPCVQKDFLRAILDLGGVVHTQADVHFDHSLVRPVYTLDKLLLIHRPLSLLRRSLHASRRNATSSCQR